jgi:tetratricopeptide (TPR) repeat protein
MVSTNSITSRQNVSAYTNNLSSTKISGADINTSSNTIQTQNNIIYPKITALSKDNVINDMIQMEASMNILTPEQLDATKEKLITLLNSIIEDISRPEHKDLPIETKIQIAYKNIWASNKAKEQFKDPSFIGNLYRGELDCDTSSYVIIALSQELAKVEPAWNNVSMNMVPNHAYIRYNNMNRDYGRIKLDSYYKERYILKPLNLKGHDILIFPILHNTAYYSKYLDADKVIEAYDKAIEIAPNSSLIYYFRGDIYLQYGGIYGIRSSRLPEHETDNPFDYAQVLDRYKPAISDLTKAIELDNNNYLAYLERGKIYLDVERLIRIDYVKKAYYKELAIKDLSDSIRIAPNNYESLMERAELYSSIEKPDLAMKDYNKLIKLYPRSYEVLYAVSEMYSARGQVLKATMYRLRGDVLQVSKKNDK